MHKFYWNNTHRGAGAGANGGGSSSATSVKIHQAPQLTSDASSKMNALEVPARSTSSTTIRVESRDQRATTPSGSHRVLLKLKKMNSSRPKSLHGEAGLDDTAAAAEVSASKKKSSLPSSRSMHHFYNRTWNERSLTKYANQHDYENVYANEESSSNSQSGQQDYENVLTFCHGKRLEASAADENGLVISQLTCSPRSTRARLFQPPQPEHHVPPVPPERKGRGRKRDSTPPVDVLQTSQHQPPQQRPLFRSKSCERPKMREAMRDTFRISSEKFAANLNRISSNFTDKILASKMSHHFEEEASTTTTTAASGEIVANNGSLLHSVAFRAIPCVDTQTSSSSHYYGQRQQQLYHHQGETQDDEYGRNSSSSHNNNFDLDSSSDLNVRPPTAASYASSTTSRPSLALANRMKGLRKDMQEKISRFRSRSAERIAKRSLLRRRESTSPERVSQRSTSICDDDDLSDFDVRPTATSTAFRMTKSYSGLPAPIQVYNGPFMGRARALVDYIPSPYDRDALRFNRGDTIDIISMNPSGLWRGKSQGRVGHFKFINVELLPDRNTLRQQRRSASEKLQAMESSGPPKTVEDLLKRIGLEEHLSVFVLNGYEELDNFHDLNESELDYLGITDQAQRTQILTAVELMQDNTSTLSTASENNDDDTDPDTEKNCSSPLAEKAPFERNNFPRDSGCFASSSPASDRSSQQSQSESGIHLPHDDEDEDEDHNSSCDEPHMAPKRPAEKSAQTRNLRDRHTITTQDLEKLSLTSSQNKDSFEALVEKYMSPKASLESGHVSNARSIFEATSQSK